MIGGWFVFFFFGGVCERVVDEWMDFPGLFFVILLMETNPALCGMYLKKTRNILKIMGLINYLSSECRISSSISTLWSTPSPRMQSSPPGL